MRKLALATALPVVVIAGLLAAPASAGGGSFPTTFGDVGVSCGIDPPNPVDICLYSGYIDSPRAKCIPNRKVKMFALVGVSGDPELVDVGTTSKKGAFGGLGRPSDVSAAKFRAVKRVIGGGDNRVVCRGKSITSA
jgi:hypothetical protein